METPFDYFLDDRTNPRTIDALRCGPLASPLEAYARRLHEDGYATHAGLVQLRLLGCFNRWLDRKGLTSEDVNAATVEQYLRGRAQSRKLRRGDSAALFRWLTMLRPKESGVTPPPTPVEAALGHFQQYLRQEHSLSEATVVNYTPVARSFLSERFPKGVLHLQRVTAADVTSFVQRQATLVTSKRAPLVVTALRSFLRYLFLRGIVANDLATCVPTIATWSLSNVPRSLAGEQIQKILASCDKATAIGKRDSPFCSCWHVWACEPAKWLPSRWTTSSGKPVWSLCAAKESGWHRCPCHPKWEPPLQTISRQGGPSVPAGACSFAAQPCFATLANFW
jgi:site-specific recombinase XerD